MSKIKEIGLIVEDNSDFDAFRIIIQRIIKKDNLKFRKAISCGCGKLRRKAASYAENLCQKGCNMIILVHDLDRNNHDELYKDLINKMSNCPTRNNMVCIPIEEVEAWFLSDPNAIKKTFNLPKTPSISGLPETIQSPKEKIESIVKVNTNNTKLYLNTKHNSILAQNVSLELIESKCGSFKSLCDFINKFKY